MESTIWSVKTSYIYDMKSQLITVFILVLGFSASAQMGIDAESLERLKGKISIVKDSVEYIVETAKTLIYNGDTAKFIDKAERVSIINDNLAEFFLDQITS